MSSFESYNGVNGVSLGHQRGANSGPTSLGGEHTDNNSSSSMGAMVNEKGSRRRWVSHWLRSATGPSSALRTPPRMDVAIAGNRRRTADSFSSCNVAEARDEGGSRDGVTCPACGVMAPAATVGNRSRSNSDNDAIKSGEEPHTRTAARGKAVISKVHIFLEEGVSEAWRGNVADVDHRATTIHPREPPGSKNPATSDTDGSTSPLPTSVISTPTDSTTMETAVLQKHTVWTHQSVADSDGSAVAIPGIPRGEATMAPDTAVGTGVVDPKGSLISPASGTAQNRSSFPLQQRPGAHTHYADARRGSCAVS